MYEIVIQSWSYLAYTLIMLKSRLNRVCLKEDVALEVKKTLIKVSCLFIFIWCRKICGQKFYSNTQRATSSQEEDFVRALLGLQTRTTHKAGIKCSSHTWFLWWRCIDWVTEQLYASRTIIYIKNKIGTQDKDMCTVKNELRHEKTCLRESPTRPDTNRPAQPQKPATVTKFRI